MLAEFRVALRHEIEAARRNESSSAVPLVNGRRIAQVGGSWQYTFTVENILNLPGDAPGDLYVPGHAPFDVFVISVEGMAVTLGVPADLGVVVPSARLQSNLAQLMRKLIDRIEGWAGRSNQPGDRICGLLAVGGEPISVDSVDGLNEHQAEAVGSSLGRNATFIWGPPGTGKTEAIGSIGKWLYQTGRSVLVVSHTNAAVDQAVLRIAAKLPSQALERGRVLRVGDPRDERLRTPPDNPLLLKTHVDRRSAELASKRDAAQLEIKTTTARVLDLSHQIVVVEWLVEAKDDLGTMERDLEGLRDQSLVLERQKQELSILEAKTEYWRKAANDARKANWSQANVMKLDGLIAKEQEYLVGARKELENTKEQLAEARLLHERTSSVGWLTRAWRRLPSPEYQLAIVQRLDGEVSRLNDTTVEADTRMVLLTAKRYRSVQEIEAFGRTYSANAEGVLAKATGHAGETERLRRHVAESSKSLDDRRVIIEELLDSRLVAVRDWGLTSERAETAESMLAALQAAYDDAVARFAGLELSSLRAECDRANGRIRSLTAELQLIEESLKKVEELVIADAMVVATTLTRAYLRDSIQSRRFDTVVLDEASMAPIPALWVAAGLAEKNAVVVGDPMQLPPIVLSTDEMAKKWLGRDIFTVANMGVYEVREPHFVKLTTQYRMHPAISAIPNALVYKGMLDDGTIERDGKAYSLLDDGCDAPDVARADDRFLAWYRTEWGHDTPVLLVNTASLGAWVTSVSRGVRTSRLNFLSATVCVDIASQLLRNGRAMFEAGKAPRLLIACPYRPHAKLLQLLLREEGLENEVAAGTAHSFQGSEAGAVILDLVNDEPHWRVGMFMPDRNDEVRRLLNVALTRARRRLIVVGDFDYIMALAKKAFLGAELVPFLRARYPCVDARQVIPTGFAARAAKAQSSVLGGEVEPSAARAVLTQERFYPILRRDLTNAKTRIVIYSPFVTSERLGQLQPQLCAAVERGVRVYIVTKAPTDRRKSELRNYRYLEGSLARWKVVIVHKRRMHEKLVFIDDEILWSGSLNPLSFADTQEVMERRVSRDVVRDFAQTLRLDELLAEYEGGLPTCPICGSEVVATEGDDEPYYWRCVEEDCYSRSIDQPKLEGGLITCANCGGAVEYGEWGGEPHWRCVVNRQHRQRVARTHLRLPKMRSLVPNPELRRLDKLYGMGRSRPHPGGRAGQLGLFERPDD